MSSGTFSSPLFVKCQTHIVQEIASPADAIDFLNEWPEDRRDRIYEAALRRALMHTTDEYLRAQRAILFSALGNRWPYWKMQPPRCMARCLHVGRWKAQYRRRSRM
ncbi:DUF982 domain-containing protein [Mesorhizobium sp. M1365]|uniref:DUF982 domain-containing protein n=1 Tax=Mesorhizobium sp. M1365 TaxID=2957090 RepID=UPI00333B13FC